MRLQKRLTVLILSVLLLCTFGITAYAHDIPDVTRKGSVSVTMTYGKQSVAGGSLTLYRVGAVVSQDGNASFVLTGDFTDSGADLSNLTDESLANQLAEYAEARNLTGEKAEIGSGGTVSFTGLDLGLYLLVQEEAADGYQAVAPFLVCVPMRDNGSYCYDVDASPKVELEKKPVPPPTSEKPEKPDDPTLPQTGQLNWPIPVLVVLGLMLFSAGWGLYLGKKRGRYEK